jgi:pimeloyl-ACP methyl ester carboxylesterase
MRPDVSMARIVKRRTARDQRRIQSRYKTGREMTGRDTCGSETGGTPGNTPLTRTHPFRRKAMPLPLAAVASAVAPAIAPQRHETVLCLHSSGSSGRQFSRLAGSFDPSLEVLCPELLGYDVEASWELGREMSLDDEVERLLPLIDARSQGVHVLGHSYGGSVALQLALHRPERVKSLTLYEPVRFGVLFGDETTQASAREAISIGLEVGRKVLAGQLRGAAALFVDYWSGHGAWEGLGHGLQDSMLQRMPKIRAEYQALFADPVPRSAYERLHMPVRLLGGSRSPRPVRDIARVLASRLPRPRWLEIIGAGHMAPLAQPALVAQFLPKWMQPSGARGT